jgi:DNA-binding XRE family transcriptional regulator
MSIKKYFWSLNPKALKETAAILKNPLHPKFLERAFTLLSRCDRPKDIFSALPRPVFLATWPRLRRYWAKMNRAADFKAWWETVYEQLGQKERTEKSLRGKPAEIFLKIGGIIKAKRSKKGISQLDFARQAGMTQPDISAIESGRTNITLETLIRLCKILGIKSLPFS